MTEAAGVPELVAKVSPQLDILFVKEHIEPQRGASHGTKAQRISAVLVNQFKWFGRVAQALGHLAILLIANDPGVIDILKRQIAAKLIAGHDHARDPEENNVRSRNQIRGGIKLFEGIGFLWPTHCGKGPQP